MCPDETRLGVPPAGSGSRREDAPGAAKKRLRPSGDDPSRENLGALRACQCAGLGASPSARYKPLPPKRQTAFRSLRFTKTPLLFGSPRRGFPLAHPDLGDGQGLQQPLQPETNTKANTMTESKALNAADLRQFTGSEHWYRHCINRAVLFTDGAKYVADTAEAYWLLDEIALIQPYEKSVAGEGFQVWKLQVNPDQSAVLTCEDGNGHAVFSKRIEYTDFPLEKITLYFTNNTILLPSEY
jgi:hypothetical protein